MKKLHLVFAFAFVMLVSSTAFAGVTMAKLVGSWKGTLTLTMGEATQKFDVEITFGKDGSMLASMPGESAQKGYFQVDKSGKSITMLDEDKKAQAVVTITKFDGKTLSGSMKLTDPNMPPELKGTISLTKS